MLFSLFGLYCGIGLLVTGVVIVLIETIIPEDEILEVLDEQSFMTNLWVTFVIVMTWPKTVMAFIRG